MRLVEPSLAVLREYIDWQFFFYAWELKGKFPADPRRPGEGRGGARASSTDANELLDKIVAEELLTARGVYGYWPARPPTATTSCSRTARASACCASRPTTATSGRTARSRTSSRLRRLARITSARSRSRPGSARTSSRPGSSAEHDDYSAIIAKALADRLAEAFAEYLHERARREWYEAGERLPKEDLIAERFRGIRPAFGYPACPDHTEKPKLFDLLGRARVGIELTETNAMLPAASVSGIYLAHPAARYFSRRPSRTRPGGRLRGRKGASVAEVERWLTPESGLRATRVLTHAPKRRGPAARFGILAGVASRATFFA